MVPIIANAPVSKVLSKAQQTIQEHKQRKGAGVRDGEKARYKLQGDEAVMLKVRF